MSPQVDLSAPLPPVSSQIISLDGQIVDTSQPVWQVRSAVDGGKMIRFNWERMNRITVDGQCVYSQQARHLTKLYLSDCLTRRKATTASVYFASFIKFGRWLAKDADRWRVICQPGGFEWSSYDEDLARSWLSWGIQHTASNGDYFRHLRIFYIWGVARQYPDFTLETARILQAVKPMGHPVGHHVRFRHQTEGPFSPAEKADLIQTLQAERGRPVDRALVMLHLELGLNPKAVARLLNRDFKRVETSQGVFYQLDIPRVKKRHAERETRRRPISQRLGQLLEQLRQGEPDDHLLHWLSPNQPESSIGQAMRRWAQETALISARTGQRLKLNPRRFRYTLATHLAEEGASKFHLAQILDHTDLKYVEVYVETTSTIATQVAEATDGVLAPLVNRFLGKIIDDLEQPASPELSVNQIIPVTAPHLPLPRLKVGGVGVCGRNVRREGLCPLFPPLSCYLCPSFAALRDGPHRDLLTSIESFLTSHGDQLEQRILVQLHDVQQAIQELVAQVEMTTAETRL